MDGGHLPLPLVVAYGKCFPGKALQVKLEVEQEAYLPEVDRAIGTAECQSHPVI